MKEKYDIGILSVNLNSRICNFGAALHSYAFHKYLEKIGANSVIINYYPESISKNFITQEIKKNLKELNFYNLFANLNTYIHILYKKRKFKKFFKTHTKITTKQYDINNIETIDFIKQFIAETDTLWHKFNTGYDRAFFCDLPNMKNKNNIAYSVDFGSKKISEQNKIQFKNFMNNFKYISIRNILKIDYFKDITERKDAVVTIDPVFLLNYNDYKNIIKKPKRNNYVLCFNCVENNPTMVDKAKTFAKENNLKLITINSYVNNIKNIYAAFPTPIGIEEFLGLLENANTIFTNSYHGICFSIIFKKPFVCFRRQGNNDKILTLLELFDLHSQLYSTEEPVNMDINYEKVHKRLSELKEDSENFIKRAISNS